VNSKNLENFWTGPIINTDCSRLEQIRGDHSRLEKIAAAKSHLFSSTVYCFSVPIFVYFR